jgi:hypothetical protein
MFEVLPFWNTPLGGDECVQSKIRVLEVKRHFGTVDIPFEKMFWV